MSQKVLVNNAGQIQEYASKVTGGGSGDIPALDASSKLDSSYMPVGVEIETQAVVCSENLAAGAVVNLWNSAGVLKVRNADATAAGKEANGFVLSAYTTGQTATVYRKGMNTGRTGLTIGTKYFLDTTAGAITATAPSATGNVVQPIGVADSATEIYFIERNTIVLA